MTTRQPLGQIRDRTDAFLRAKGPRQNYNPSSEESASLIKGTDNKGFNFSNKKKRKLKQSLSKNEKDKHRVKLLNGFRLRILSKTSTSR